MKEQQILDMTRLMKAMAHPIRLKILCLLQEREMSVGEIRDRVETTHANISQHLTVLRHQGIIDYRRDANFIYNYIADGRITDLIVVMQRLFCSGIR